MTTAAGKQPSQFEELLKSLNEVETDAADLAKSIPAKGAAPDDAAVAAAAAEAAGDENDEDPEGEDKGDPLAKSNAADPEAQLVDATDLIKSLMDRADETDGVLAKAMTVFAGTIKTQSTLIKEQGVLIKSLQDQVAKIGGQGAGRKALLAAVEKVGTGADTLAKSEGGQGEGMTPQDFLAKSNEAYAAKKITGLELTTIDACVRNNMPIDARLLQKVALS